MNINVIRQKSYREDKEKRERWLNSLLKNKTFAMGQAPIAIKLITKYFPEDEIDSSITKYATAIEGLDGAIVLSSVEPKTLETLQIGTIKTILSLVLAGIEMKMLDVLTRSIATSDQSFHLREFEEDPVGYMLSGLWKYDPLSYNTRNNAKHIHDFISWCHDNIPRRDFNITFTEFILHTNATMESFYEDIIGGKLVEIETDDSYLSTLYDTLSWVMDYED